MPNSQHLNKLIQEWINSLPPQFLAIKNELESHLHQGIQAILNKLELATREELDIQSEVLKKTRQKLEGLEHRLKRLEEDPKI